MVLCPCPSTPACPGEPVAPESWVGTQNDWNPSVTSATAWAAGRDPEGALNASHRTPTSLGWLPGAVTRG